MNKTEYITRLERTVSRLHHCEASFHETVPVRQVLDGKTSWEGDVAVLHLEGHPIAKWAYAWFPGGNDADESESVIIALKLKSSTSPVNAIREYLKARAEREIATRN